MMIDCPAGELPMSGLPLGLVDELNHRVINEYSEAISSLSLAARSSHPHARAAIAGAAALLFAHAEAHRALAPPRDRGAVNLARYIGDICASLSKASLAERGVHLTLRTDEIWSSPDRCWRMGLIIAELVRNASRHGLAGKAGAILVRLSERSGSISCLVADNGRGKPNSKEGRGTRLVRSIAFGLGGTVDWRLSPTGSLARFEIPNSDAAAAGRLIREPVDQA